jgi:radical SAM-linked protein
MHKLEVKFSKGPEVKYISHLDLMRLWRRALLRADIPVVYSKGFNPHPRISLALPLPLSVESSAELMEVSLGRRMAPLSFMQAVSRELPPGIEILEVREVPPKLPSLQSRIMFAEYEVEVKESGEGEKIPPSIRAFLMKESIPWEHMRDTGARSYDLRPLVDDIWIKDQNKAHFILGMKLKPQGRADQVVKALGISSPRVIRRTRLTLK